MPSLDISTGGERKASRGDRGNMGCMRRKACRQGAISREQLGWPTSLQCLGDGAVGYMETPSRKSSSPGKAPQGMG